MCYSQNMKVTYVLWILCLCCVDVSVGCMLKIIPHLSKVLHCCFDAAVARLLFLFLCEFLLIHCLSFLLSLVVVVPLWVLCCCSIVAVFGLSIGSCCLWIIVRTIGITLLLFCHPWRSYGVFLRLIWLVCLDDITQAGFCCLVHPIVFWSLVIVVVLLMIQHRKLDCNGTVAALPIALVHSCLLSGTGSWCHRILLYLLLCLCVL